METPLKKKIEELNYPIYLICYDLVTEYFFNEMYNDPISVYNKIFELLDYYNDLDNANLRIFAIYINKDNKLTQTQL